MMNILLLGSGGREHAMAWKISQSPRCSKLFIAPGNAGTSQCGANVAISVTDFQAIKNFVLENDISMVLVGPEDPLVEGIHDFFLEDDKLKKIPVIGQRKMERSWRAVRIFQNTLCRSTVFPLLLIKVSLKNS